MSIPFGIVEDFSEGFRHKRDVTQMSPGALIVGSKNVVITDGDRVGLRKGSRIFGATSSTASPIEGLHTFKKRNGDNVMLRSYGSVLEYYHTGTEAWTNLNSGYLSAKFGFADHNINDDYLEYVYFCNGVDAYSRWTGQFTQLNGALAGGETTVTVDSVLTDDVYASGTAASVTTTTLTISASDWATDIWVDFYVYITSGAASGQIAKISGNTATTLTFATIGTLAGTPTFEIRKVAFNDSSDRTLRIGTTDVTYTGFGSATTFTGCSSVPAASDNAAVTQAVKEYPGNPRGNILIDKNTRMFVANVKGKESSLYYSKIADATDFTFSSPRVPDDGGIIDTPEGGGGIVGLGIQEDTIYILKEDLIKTLTFTTDNNDFPIIQPLIQAPQVGASSRLGVFKIDNQQFFTSKEGGVKAVGRVAAVDYVQPLQLSDSIVSFVKNLGFSSAAGIFYRQKAYIAVRDDGSTANDLILVYNAQKQAWEAPIYGWNANCWTIYNGNLYFGSSSNPEVYQVEVDEVYDDNEAPYEAVARFAYYNFKKPTSTKHFTQLFMEGYISENTTITVKVRYNYLGQLQTKEMTLSGTDENYIIAGTSDLLLGNYEIGSQPLAGIDEEDAPSPLQKFRVYFDMKAEQFYEMSVEVSSNEVGSQWEVLRFGVNAVEDAAPVKKLTKSLA